MKKLDLKIQIDEKMLPKDTTVIDTAINYLLTAVNRAINKPDARGMATNNANMDTQRIIARIMRVLDGHKDGIAEIEDSDFDFIYKKFHQAEFPVGRDISPILFELENKLNEANK